METAEIKKIHKIPIKYLRHLYSRLNGGIFMKKFKPLLTVMALVAIVMTVVACTSSAYAEESYVTIDINPSVELIVNARERVVYVNALNEDAEVLLADLDLVGMPVDEATDLIIETAIALGYIDVESTDTVVQVSSTSDSALGEKIRERVMAAVNNAFQNRGIYGRAEGKEFTEEFLAEAESYGVTPGCLFLAKAVVAVQDDLTLEDALLMTQEELRDILKVAKEEAKEVLFQLRDEFFAARDEIRAEYEPTLEQLHVDIADVQAQIADVEAQIAIESTEELVAQLEALQAELTDLQDQLQATLDEMHAEIAALRDDFHAQSEALYPELMQRMEGRREQFQNRLQEWIDAHEGSNWRDIIEEYQNNNNPDNNPNNGE